MINSLTFNRHSEPTLPLHTAYRPAYALVVQGAKSVTVGSEHFRYGSGHYLLTSLDLPVKSQVLEASADQPYLSLTMEIDREKLIQILDRAGPSLPLNTLATLRGSAVNSVGKDLLNATLRLLRLFDKPEDIPAMAALIEQEIIYRLLRGPDGPRLMHISLAESQGNRVGRAIKWLRRNFAEPLKIGELATHVGMSPSSLHHHFKLVTAMTPIQYQKQLRLQEARHLMLAKRIDVGTAGFQVGYRSPSQFSREYSRMFGAPPARDVEATLLARPELL